MPVLSDRSAAAPPLAPPGAGLGASALVLGGLGTLFVAGAVGLSIGAPPALTGLALASVGLVLAAGGLVLGTVGAVGAARRGRRRDRTAISAAGISVVGLSGALIWLAAFVITVLSGPVPALRAEPGGVPACAPPTCAAP